MNDSHEKKVTSDINVISVRDYGKDIKRRLEEVSVEEPIHIFVNKVHYASVFCTPSDQESLVVGNLMSEGLIHSLDEIARISVEERGVFQVQLQQNIEVSKRIELSASFKRLILSSCGSANLWPLPELVDRLSVPEVDDPTTFDSKMIIRGVTSLNKLATTYRRTHGVHAAALYDNQGTLIAFAEDIGRHNAVDKVIGLRCSEGKLFGGTMLASTGRLTGDMVLKAARMRIPLVASMAVAINSGIEIAEKTGVTLIGFVLGDRMTIYSFQERIVYDKKGNCRPRLHIERGA